MHAESEDAGGDNSSRSSVASLHLPRAGTVGKGSVISIVKRVMTQHRGAFC